MLKGQDSPVPRQPDNPNSRSKPGHAVAALLGLLLQFAGNPHAGAAEPFTDERQLGLKYSALATINTNTVRNLEDWPGNITPARPRPSKTHSMRLK